MNERIKLLADQAEDYATAEYDKWIPTPDFSGIPHIRKIFNEKFAELIVRECADMAESFHRHQYDMTGNLELHEFIREHFGVEE